MTDKEKNPRALAVDVLLRVSKGAYSNIELKNTIAESKLSQLDINLLTEIVYGVIQHKLTLEFDLAPFIGHKRVEDWVKQLLLSAVFQMVYLDRVPTRAIFNESIEIAKVRGHSGIRAFVTGVLHEMQRVGIPELSADQKDYRSIKYSVAPWLVEQLDKELGTTKTDQILESINHPSRQAARVNTNATTQSEVIDQLNEDGYQAEPSKVAKDGVIVTEGSIGKSPLFGNGALTIQDESAMLVGEAMQLDPGMEVLDACAAPGGKTTHIAQKIGEEGHVLALDLHPKKVGLIKQNAKRMGLDERVTTKALDARKIDSIVEDDYFDRILVDAPCSGIGLMRRKPEIRYEKTLEDSQNLHKIQLGILNAMAPKVKDNGIITYSTCTILEQENEKTISAFLELHPEFKLIPTQTVKHLKEDRSVPYLNIYPDDFGSDGFFIACLQKRA
ncbi:Ribosomal RNA small subunit methyltransferase B [Pediococcus damnosus]|uniref:16S rRNA (cytosine(967)-C(5))-methyltransferase n=1 Tax=Pediococcus damnosus TaxID=51663 RepID=A0A0R2HBD7_9LACO|nr:16S rRNA (cytosine(967)-C(5))-methyltransferase RsmB [Pediococcus damnosus]AMV61425.1 Ribosomal RNA small subunit methyltransferase B [Pediococcus damnosus]AMV62217.1 Ribosomal RNA small subunit methyltransferase B [Pediococcus damnosus]AMV65788.1 Ribosomal RNA small subunit methyltransferase B [Pediococcus damnosus]AMV67926.1 Ribosomal RNA small subunit methyltransferase B [Pediococcus damnosus]AMV70125.1 Ribosomal RNA small subunit methyltransferase B [Pediococcus damnosus]